MKETTKRDICFVSFFVAIYYVGSTAFILFSNSIGRNHFSELLLMNVMASPLVFPFFITGFVLKLKTPVPRWEIMIEGIVIFCGVIASAFLLLGFISLALIGTINPG